MRPFEINFFPRRHLGFEMFFPYHTQSKKCLIFFFLRGKYIYIFFFFFFFAQRGDLNFFPGDGPLRFIFSWKMPLKFIFSCRRAFKVFSLGFLQPCPQIINGSLFNYYLQHKQKKMLKCRVHPVQNAIVSI